MKRLWRKIQLIRQTGRDAGIGLREFVGPRNIIGMIRYDRRPEGSLKVGDRAPDVVLLALDKKTPVRLAASVGDKPLILIFGSFT